MNEREHFLQSLGWNKFFQTSLDKIEDGNLAPGRIIGHGRGGYRIQVAPEHVFDGAVNTKLRRWAESDKSVEFPAVGDWVLYSRESGQPQVSIHQVLKRKSVIQRLRSGAQHNTQVIAANVDFMLVTSSLNEDFDLAQLGRYLDLGRNSGATPVILLTKSDLCANPDQFVKLCEAEFKNIEIILISSKNTQSLEVLQKYFSAGLTSVLIGSSGVGKSTLTNYLLGSDLQKTQGLSYESRGKHTTTARHLLVTRWNGLVIDTPGMQEVSSLDAADPNPEYFSVIEETKLKCKFTNCRHDSDPGCAITSALKNGTLSRESWDEYLEAAADVGRRKKKRT